MRKLGPFLILLFVVAAAAIILLARDQGKQSFTPAQAPASFKIKTSQIVPPLAAPTSDTYSQGSELRNPTREENNTIVLMQDIKSAINAGDFSAALALADRLMEESPGDEIALIRARILSSLGRGEEAFDALDDILATSDDAEILRQAAARYFIAARDAGLLSEALAQQQARINNQSDDPAMLSVMAQLYAYDRDENNELRTREHLQTLHPAPENLARIIEIQNSLGLTDDASASVAELAKITDANTAAHLLLKQAEAENAAKRYDLAVLSAKRGLTLPEVTPFMTVRFARELEAAGDVASALTTLEGVASAAETPEVQDRATLEICRIQLKHGQSSRELSTQLTQLRQSRVPYVQEQAAHLLQQAQ